MVSMPVLSPKSCPSLLLFPNINTSAPRSLDTQPSLGAECATPDGDCVCVTVQRASILASVTLPPGQLSKLVTLSLEGAAGSRMTIGCKPEGILYCSKEE